jgi:hypothetical protein
MFISRKTLFSSVLILVILVVFFSCETKQNVLKRDSSIVISSNSDSPKTSFENSLKKNEQGINSSPTSDSINIITGKFKGIEEGDYFYFDIYDDKNKIRAYRFSKESKINREDYMSNKFKNKRVKVIWKQKYVYVKEAGAYENVDILVDIEFLE